MHGDGPARTRQLKESAPPPRHFPDMPSIGHPETYYANRVHQADRAGDIHAHAVNKVGQYVTLALDQDLTWEQKLKYFQHAIKRHCALPPYPDDEVWLFYQKLADLVRQYCGHEALRLASQEDDLYVARLNMGQDRTKIDSDAAQFFGRIMGNAEQRLEWFNESDWFELRLIRGQWL